MPAGRSLRAEGLQAEQTAPVESRGRSARVEDGGDGRFTVLQPTRRARQLGQGLVVTGTGLLHTGRTHECLVDLTIDDEIDAQPAALTEVVGQRGDSDGLLDGDRTIDEAQRLLVPAAGGF